jgi:hypothetical protein
MTQHRSQGRAVPPAYPAARVDLAEATYATHAEAMAAAAKRLPNLLRLGDGRKLRFDAHMSGGKAYRCADGMAVIATYDPTPHGTLLHISASYPARLPSWQDLGQLRAVFFPPDTDVIQVLPRAGDYVNVHQFCLHLFQAPDAWQGGWNV